MGTVRKGICDRHHILYPHQIWRDQPSLIRDLRGAFTFKINKDLHRQLHTEVDATLGENVDENYLPSESTLELIANTYTSNKTTINELEPTEKIDWLLNNLNDADPRNSWLRTMLESQSKFLRTYTEGS